MPRVLSAPGLALRVVAYLAAATGAGALCGVLWWRVVDLPGYTVGPDGSASTGQRGLTQYVSADAWFTLIGLVAGAAVGWLAWRVFRTVGWPVVLLALVAALAAALSAWAVGHQLGPGPFAVRLGQAQPGEVVPVELTVRARAALLVWPFAAVLPILLASSLGNDDEVSGAPPWRPGRTEPDSVEPKGS